MLKEQKLSAVKLVSTGKIKSGRGEHKPVKKQKQVLIFAKFEAEKISSTESQGILKAQKQNPEVFKADY